LKTYSFATYNVTLRHDECEVDFTTLGRNIVNLNPKPEVYP